MAAPQGKVPILETARAGAMFAAREIRTLWPVVAIGAVLMAALDLAVARAGAAGRIDLSLLAQISGVSVTGFVLAAFLGRALRNDALEPRAIFRDGGRVLGAMAIVGFFLLIVFGVAAIPGVVAFGMVVAPYANQIQAAAGDAAASLVVIEQIAREHPTEIVLIALIYALIWLALTSRLYLAAPATIADGRVRTFETWPWTKNNVLRIVAVRLLVLIPAWMLVGLIQYVAGAVLGVPFSDPSAFQGLAVRTPIMFAIVDFVGRFAWLALYAMLEAGVAAYLYRGLRPAA